MRKFEKLSDPFDILCSLCGINDLKGVKKLLDSNLSMDINQKGGLVLNFAIMGGRRFPTSNKEDALEIVKLLHKAGANLGINDGYKIEFAIDCDNVAIVKYIIENIDFIPEIDKDILDKFYEKHPEEKAWLSERVKGIEINVEELLSTLQPANNINENENTRKFVTEKRKLSPQDEKNENFVKRLKVDDKDSGLKVR